MTVWYRTGTASVANGGTTVTGILTTWANQAYSGDWITFDAGSSWHEIGTVDGHTTLTLAVQYPGTTVSGGAYAIAPRSPFRDMTSDLHLKVSRLLDRMTVLSSSSTTSLTIGTGSKTITVEDAGLELPVGSRASIIYDALHQMTGTVTALSGLSLTINVDAVIGSGTFAQWTVSIAGMQGPQGAQGSQGVAGAIGAQGQTGAPGEITRSGAQSGGLAKWVSNTQIGEVTGNVVLPAGLTTAGNVGVGTASPWGRLCLPFDSKISLGMATGYRFDIYKSSAGSLFTYFDSFDNDSTNKVLFRMGTAGTPVEVLTLQANGRVGIGTSAPTATLHNAGTTRLSAFGAGTLTTDASGNVSSSSDEALKYDIQPFHRGLDAIQSINPISFLWTSASGMDRMNRYHGFSAQNVEAAIPEAVGVGADGFLTLQDRPILAALVNAVKTLAEQNAGLIARIDALEQGA